MLRDVAISPIVPTPWLTVDDVKAYLGIAGSGEDTALTAWLGVACQNVEAYCGTVFSQRTVVERVTPDDATRSIVLRHCPVIALTEVKFDEVAETLSDYRVALQTGVLRRVDYGSLQGNADWLVTYTAGYAGGSVPAAVVQATKDLIKHFRQNKSRDASVRKEAVPDVGEVEYADDSTILVPGQNGVSLPGGVAMALAPYVQRFVP